MDKFLKQEAVSTGDGESDPAEMKRMEVSF
jgi:hypothetical protein